MNGDDTNGNPRREDESVLFKHAHPPCSTRPESLFLLEKSYRVESFVGAGTYGKVFRVKDPEGKVHALKSFAGADADSFYTNIREAGALATLKGHPNILDVTDIEMTASPGKHWLVTELLQGSLESLIAYHADDLSKRIAMLDWAVPQLCEGLCYMHRRGFVHRDIKPANVLFGRPAPDAVVFKLADFGLSRTMGCPGAAFTGQVVTAGYRAPELLFGPRPAEDPELFAYNPCVDVWALGVVFLEVLLGGKGFWPHFRTEQPDVMAVFEVYRAVGLGPFYSDALKKLPDLRHAPPPMGMEGYLKRRLGEDRYAQVPPKVVYLLQHILDPDPVKRMAFWHAHSAPAKNDPRPHVFPASAMKRIRERHPEIGGQHRSVLISWMADVCRVEFMLRPRTLFAAVDALDGYMARIKGLPLSKYQLAGASCLLLASWLVDVSVATAEGLADCSKGAYTARQAYRNALRVFTMLGFRYPEPVSSRRPVHGGLDAYHNDKNLWAAYVKALAPFPDNGGNDNNNNNPCSS